MRRPDGDAPGGFLLAGRLPAGVVFFPACARRAPRSPLRCCRTTVFTLKRDAVRTVRCFTRAIRHTCAPSSPLLVEHSHAVDGAVVAPQDGARSGCAQCSLNGAFGVAC